MRRIPIPGSTVLALAVLAFLSIGPAMAAPLAAQPNRPGGQQGGKPNQGPRPGGQGKPGGQRPGGQPKPQPKPQPRPQPGNRPGGDHGGSSNRPGQPNRPGPRPPSHRPPPRPINRPRPHYNFGDGGNGFRLRRYFNADMARINRARRPIFLAGGYFPQQYVTYLQPIPPDVYGYLPPVPPGYAMGYYDGYTVVYDPTTYLIASVLDLFRY